MCMLILKTRLRLAIDVSMLSGKLKVESSDVLSVVYNGDLNSAINLVE